MSFYAENLLKISQNEQNAICFCGLSVSACSHTPIFQRIPGVPDMSGLQEFQYGKDFKKDAFSPKKRG
jgi:hypothetical protein